MAFMSTGAGHGTAVGVGVDRQDLIVPGRGLQGRPGSHMTRTRGLLPHAGQVEPNRSSGRAPEGSIPAALAGYVEDAIRECLEYDRTELNQGEDFPPVTDHLRPVGGSAGSGLVDSGFRLARML